MGGRGRKGGNVPSSIMRPDIGREERRGEEERSELLVMRAERAAEESRIEELRFAVRWGSGELWRGRDGVVSHSLARSMWPWDLHIYTTTTTTTNHSHNTIITALPSSPHFIVYTLTYIYIYTPPYT